MKNQKPKIMTNEKKETLRKALELAMENSENITISQSNNVIAQVQREPEPETPVICKIHEKVLNEWTSIMTVIIGDMLHKASVGRMHFDTMAKYTKAIDALRQAIFLQTYPEYGGYSGLDPDQELISEMIGDGVYWEPHNDGNMPHYNYFNE